MIEAASENYHGRGLEFLKFPNGGILLRTMDICLIAGISGRDGGRMGYYLNLASAISIADSRDREFAMWLAERFADYDSRTEELQ